MLKTIIASVESESQCNNQFLINASVIRNDSMLTPNDTKQSCCILVAIFWQRTQRGNSSWFTYSYIPTLIVNCYNWIARWTGKRCWCKHDVITVPKYSADPSMLNYTCFAYLHVITLSFTCQVIPPCMQFKEPWALD